MMRVLLVTETIHPGGAETFVLRLARKLSRRGIAVDILSLNPDLEKKELVDRFSDLVVHRIQLPMLRWIKRLDRLFRLAGIDFSLQLHLNKKIIRKKYLHQYDVFHTHLINVDHLFASLKKGHPRICIVSTLHGDYNEYEKFWQEKNGHRKLNWPKKIALLQKAVNAWVYISRHQAALFSGSYGIGEEKLHKIYNGYETDKVIDQRIASPGSPLRFIMVARGIKGKGWDFAINAFRNLPGEHELVLVGQGDYLQLLRERYANVPRLSFYGFHPDPVELIGASDVFLFPSVYKTESLPTVIIEALYCGVPVISTDIGEVSEMLVAPQTGSRAGILVDKEDEAAIVPHFTTAMLGYINNRALLQDHSNLAKQAFDKFRMDVCCDKYVELYTAVCSNPDGLPKSKSEK